MTSYEQPLGDGLVLRTIRDDQDVERFADLHSVIISAAEGATCAYLPKHRPGAAYDDFFLVEDRATGEVVSSICLLPWRCRLEDVNLDFAMLEMVSTHLGYRHRGLVRAQIERYHQVVAERSFDLSIIEGIPYYYRQFGYAYAVEHWGTGDSLPASRIPDRPEDTQSPIRLRPATLADAPALTQMYRAAMQPLQLYTERDVEYWRFLMQWAHYPVQMVEDAASGNAVGYICTRAMWDGRGVSVLESSIASPDVGMAVLAALRDDAVREIHISWPQTNTLVQLGRSLGSVPLPRHQWLLRITDVGGLLAKLAPLFERRLAAAAWGNLTDDLCLNLYRQAYRLRFEAGKLSEVTSLGFVDASMGADGGDLCIPPDAFVRLVLGYRDLDELSDAWPDIMVKSARRRLLQTLFPKLAAYFIMPYSYCGDL